MNGRKVLKVFVPVPFIGSDEPAGVLALAQDYAADRRRPAARACCR